MTLVHSVHLLWMLLSIECRTSNVECGIETHYSFTIAICCGDGLSMAGGRYEAINIRIVEMMKSW